MKINLSLIGSEEMILEEVAHKDAFLKAKFPLAHIVEKLEPIPTSIPDWIATQEKVSVWDVITRELTNLIKI